MNSIYITTLIQASHQLPMVAYHIISYSAIFPHTFPSGCSLPIRNFLRPDDDNSQSDPLNDPNLIGEH